MGQDLLIKYSDEAGCFDLVSGEQDFETVDGLETSVAVLLFTDARAAPDQVSKPEKRRGWVGNTLHSRELGGMLWLLSQVRNTQDIRNKSVNFANDSLQPLIEEGIASEIVTIAELNGIRGMNLSIEIIIKEGESSKFDYSLDTNLGNLINGN